jgi:hypothetical protein
MKLSFLQFYCLSIFFNTIKKLALTSNEQSYFQVLYGVINTDNYLNDPIHGCLEKNRILKNSETKVMKYYTFTISLGTENVCKLLQ